MFCGNSLSDLMQSQSELVGVWSQMVGSKPNDFFSESAYLFRVLRQASALPAWLKPDKWSSDSGCEEKMCLHTCRRGSVRLRLWDPS
jgi:hypothetical protein